MWRSVQRGQGRSQMPRLLLGPQRSISTSMRASQNSSGDIVYRMNPAVSSSSEWEGAGKRRNHESRMLLFLIPMRLFFLPSFKSNSFLGTHSTAFYTHATARRWRSIQPYCPSLGCNCNYCVSVSSPGNSARRTQMNSDHLFKVTFRARERQSCLQSQFSSRL